MKNIFNPGNFIKLISILIILGAGIYGGIWVVRFKPQLFNLNPIPGDQVEATLLSTKVGKLMSLPNDELPIVETVTDLSILKGKPFFVKAEVGDKVLIYKKAMIAILFRPSKNIIINTVSPNYEDAVISLTLPSPPSVATPSLTPMPTITPLPTATTPVPTATASINASPTPVNTTRPSASP